MRKIFKFSFVSHYYDNHHQFRSRLVEFMKDYYSDLVFNPKYTSSPKYNEEFKEDQEVLNFGEIVPEILNPITLVFCINDFPSERELIDLICEETSKRREDLDLMKECINVIIYHHV